MWILNPILRLEHQSLTSVHWYPNCNTISTKKRIPILYVLAIKSLTSYNSQSISIIQGHILLDRSFSKCKVYLCCVIVEFRILLLCFGFIAYIDEMKYELIGFLFFKGLACFNLFKQIYGLFWSEVFASKGF